MEVSFCLMVLRPKQEVPEVAFLSELTDDATHSCGSSCSDRTTARSGSFRELTSRHFLVLLRVNKGQKCTKEKILNLCAVAFSSSKHRSRFSQTSFIWLNWSQIDQNVEFDQAIKSQQKQGDVTQIEDLCIGTAVPAPISNCVKHCTRSRMDWLQRADAAPNIAEQWYLFETMLTANGWRTAALPCMVYGPHYHCGLRMEEHVPVLVTSNGEYTDEVELPAGQWNIAGMVAWTQGVYERHASSVEPEAGERGVACP
jgi:hypothetical protein